MASAVLDDWATVHHPPSSSSSPAASTTQPASAHQQKKPRHRHSPEQLAALNELFDKNEHPPLEARAALAERLAMETKTVNAWFQNKRASSKKRTRTQASELPAGSHLNTPQMSIPAPPPPLSAATTPGAQHRDLDDDDHPSHPALGHFSPLQKVSHPIEITPGSSNSSSASFFAANPDLSYFGSSRDSPDPTNMSRKMRMRPTAEQTEELKKLYNITPHPTSEDRQALAERIGMRYQSITNWFQNQRSLAKRRKEDEHTDSASTNSKSDYPPHGDMRQYSAFPPRQPHQIHPSLVFSDSAVGPQPSSSETSRTRRSPSISPSMDEHYSRRANMRRSTTPYGGPLQSRPRRSRPEPFQLDALKGLFTRTSTPTIEERSALALEIGMDVGKVTNWFRNLRQTARKRNNRHHGAGQDAHGLGSGDDEDGDGDMHDMQDDESPQYSSAVSRSGSRAGTPSRSSSASSSSLGEREMGARMRGRLPHSNIPSEDDDYPEAVTPENGRSPSPGPDRRMMHSSRPMHGRDLPPPHMSMNHRDPYTSSSSPYPPHPFYHQPPSFPPSHHHYGAPLPPMSVSRDIKPLLEPKASLGLGRFNAAVSLSEPSFYPSSKPHPHPYMDEDPIGCAKAAERFGIKLEDAYLLLDFKFHRH